MYTQHSQIERSNDEDAACWPDGSNLSEYTAALWPVSSMVGATSPDVRSLSFFTVTTCWSTGTMSCTRERLASCPPLATWIAEAPISAPSAPPSSLNRRFPAGAMELDI